MTNSGLLAAALLGSDETRKHAAWEKATPYPSFGFSNRRIDCDGRIMDWAEHGKYTEHGWHIDHTVPLALGGSDELYNLRARHWRGNCGDGGLLGSALSKIRG